MWNGGMPTRIATPSNCGNPLKPHLPSWIGNSPMAELTALGTVTTMRMEQWAIRSQVLSREQLGLCHDMDAVHRLNGGGWRDRSGVLSA
ncbi:hypothetical protein BVRB_030290 [Beta vulgaris subsp. vulgaris]|uniref:Uncharacterized protein n=1 Tax=Beta vulgaris subsp. vulgaris TaxID=3555 RepID=A0A0J8AXU7_BETVV|nr:hypothetical protein BVRB_030290 [Beta vulgaris subsp. vulgaris]